MSTLGELARGDKADVHLTLYTSELAIIDALRDHYDCSRAAVIGAWAREFAGMDLTDKVTAGRRPGGGRKFARKPKGTKK